MRLFAEFLRVLGGRGGGGYPLRSNKAATVKERLCLNAHESCSGRIWWVWGLWDLGFSRAVSLGVAKGIFLSLMDISIRGMFANIMCFLPNMLQDQTTLISNWAAAVLLV